MNLLWGQVDLTSSLHLVKWLSYRNLPKSCNPKPECQRDFSLHITDKQYKNMLCKKYHQGAQLMFVLYYQKTHLSKNCCGMLFLLSLLVSKGFVWSKFITVPRLEILWHFFFPAWVMHMFSLKFHFLQGGFTSHLYAPPPQYPEVMQQRSTINIFSSDGRSFASCLIYPAPSPCPVRI